jgi:hypothetical protein
LTKRRRSKASRLERTPAASAALFRRAAMEDLLLDVLSKARK